jgi:NTE family protein
MAEIAGLARSALLAGIGETDLGAIAELTRARTFEPGEALCRAGEPGERCWIMTAGLVEVFGEGGAGTPIARHRKGASVGDVAAILGEPYSETVIAGIPAAALELDAAALGELVKRFPQILVNALRGAHSRLSVARARSAAHGQGETVAVVAGATLARVTPGLIATARTASPRPVTSLDRRFSFAGALTTADSLVSDHATVLLPAQLERDTIAALLRATDRVVALAGSAAEASELQAVAASGDAAASIEVVLVGEEAVAASRSWPDDAGLRIIRTCERRSDFPLSDRDLAWLARHLTRTKLGLALGAGGAKGYAHVGALQVLEEAGYVVDAVAGSSIGAIVGAYLALGANAAEIDRTLRDAFTPAAVAEIFKTSLSGRSTGLEVMSNLVRQTTGERTFADTEIPLTVMSVDLTERAPAALRDGRLWEALLAATALAGVFPPYEREGHRLVDGLALVPVPSDAPADDGADVTVSVNLISDDTLERWPGAPPPEPPPERRRRGVLDNLLEVMDLSQLADSVRHARLADVVITPRFGPGEWRDFHLADLFLAAGRAAAEEQLPTLRTLALPAVADTTINHQGADIERADAVRL